MITVVFYSYKGGAGRTLALANVAQFLAGVGKRVFTLDFDFEAPGLHYKFKLKDKMPRMGVVDYLLHCQESDKPPSNLADFVSELTLDEKSEGSIWLMPAGLAPSREYATSLARLNWNLLFGADPSRGVAIFADLQAQIENEYKPDLLLIDSRTGITHIGQVAIHLLADKLVCFLLNNPENKEGLIEVLKDVIKGRATAGQSSSTDFEIVPVLSRVPLAQSQTIKQSVRDLLSKELGLDELFVLHSERKLEMEEALRIGGVRSLAVSILLRDYVRLCLRLFTKNGSFPAQIKQTLDDLTISSNYESEFSHRSLLPEPISKRILARESANERQLFVIADGNYIIGEAYKHLTNNLLEQIVSDKSKWNFIPREKIKWEVLATQIRDGVFDFCVDPYIVTQSRSHLLGIMRIGRAKTFTVYTRKEGIVHRALRELCEDPNNTGEDWTILFALKYLRKGVLKNFFEKHEEENAIGAWEDTAATTECQSALAKVKTGAIAGTFPDAAKMREWIDEEKKGARLIICDHGVVQMLNKERDESSRQEEFVAGTRELTFPFSSVLPVGFAYPVEDEEWGIKLANSMGALVSAGLLTDKNWSEVMQDLEGVGIEALTFKELCLSIMENMKLHEAIDWYDNLPAY